MVLEGGEGPGESPWQPAPLLLGTLETALVDLVEGVDLPKYNRWSVREKVVGGEMRRGEGRDE